MLSILEPESAYSAFNLNLICLSLHPYTEDADGADVDNKWPTDTLEVEAAQPQPRLESALLESALLSTLDT